MKAWIYRHFKTFGYQISQWRLSASETSQRISSQAWFFAFRYHALVRQKILRHRVLAIGSTTLFMMGGSFFFVPSVQESLGPLDHNDPRVTAFWALLSSLGGALVAAAAISFSLVVLALQVNVERMPHGLFWRFSSDVRIMAAFVGTLTLAIGIAFSSLVQDANLVAATAVAVFWAIVWMFLLIGYAYRRALYLINPIQQLSMVFSDTQKNMLLWRKKIEYARPLMKGAATIYDGEKRDTELRFDALRAAYLQANPGWANELTRATDYAVSYIKRFTQSGDYLVSKQSFDVIVAINSEYITTKGRTFFPSSAFIDNNFDHDSYITYSLEELRKLGVIALSKSDETFIEQAMSGVAALCGVYMGIDYSRDTSSKVHAQLACQHLCALVEESMKQPSIDVVLHGVRLIGGVARFVAAQSTQNEETLHIEKLVQIGGTSISMTSMRLVAAIATEQLTSLLLVLLEKQGGHTDFATAKITNGVAAIANHSLNLPEAPFSNVHGATVAAFYSTTSSNALSARLVEAANKVLVQDASSVEARNFIRNLTAWSKDLHISTKAVLLKAISVKSQSTFELLHFIERVSDVLLTCSTASACDEFVRQRLEENAIGLLEILSWIPSEKETVAFVEGSQVTEMIFRISARSLVLDRRDFAQAGFSRLLKWAFNAGRHESGWGILDKAICGLIVLALLLYPAEGATNLEILVKKRLGSENSPSPELRRRVARELKERAVEAGPIGHWSSDIFSEMSKIDRGRIRVLLERMATIFSS